MFFRPSQGNAEQQNFGGEPFPASSTKGECTLFIFPHGRPSHPSCRISPAWEGNGAHRNTCSPTPSPLFPIRKLHSPAYLAPFSEEHLILLITNRIRKPWNHRLFLKRFTFFLPEKKNVNLKREFRKPLERDFALFRHATFPHEEAETFLRFNAAHFQTVPAESLPPPCRCHILIFCARPAAEAPLSTTRILRHAF